jgi:hypothetical protein
VRTIRAWLAAAQIAGGPLFRSVDRHGRAAGLATQAALNGASGRSIMRQTGHKSVTMVRHYIRDPELFCDHAVPAGSIKPLFSSKLRSGLKHRERLIESLDLRVDGL